MAQYVSRDHVGQLNGVLGVPLAMGRAVAPWALGLMWTPEVGYAHGLRWMLLAGVLGFTGLAGAAMAAEPLSSESARAAEIMRFIGRAPLLSQHIPMRGLSCN